MNHSAVDAGAVKTRGNSAGADRAARLALAVAGVVAKARAAEERGRTLPPETLQQARLDLQELERLCGVVKVELPPPAPAKGSAERRAWVGWAPPPNEEQDAAALACWAALGEPIEAHVLGWREVLGLET